MKRILIALAVLLAVQVADAQVKPEAAKAAVESAKVAAENPKKATKVATWLKLAKTYMDAYNAPSGNVWLGATQQELQLMGQKATPLAVEQVTLAGETCTKEVYSDKEYYFNQAGQLVMINVTKPVLDVDALACALDAYKKAYEVDVKGSKTKDIATGIAEVASKYLEEGMNSYNLEDYKGASDAFGLAAAASVVEPYATLDTTALYNAGFTALMVKDLEGAKKYFEDCLAAGYYNENGDVYAKLADVYAQLGDKETSVATLEKGFAAFPQSQSILIGLINHYMQSGDNADRLFVLIDEAKKNEPNNPSLYYVEGNIHKELKNNEKAIESYYKCADIDPNYEFGYIGAGILYYDLAVEYSEKANLEYDQKKYDELFAQFEQALMNALEPFEKAYEISKDESIKVSVAEYLKNIYFRFRAKDPKFEAGYAKYDAIVRGN